MCPYTPQIHMFTLCSHFYIDREHKVSLLIDAVGIQDLHAHINHTIELLFLAPSLH